MASLVALDVCLFVSVMDTRREFSSYRSMWQISQRVRRRQPQRSHCLHSRKNALNIGNLRSQTIGQLWCWRHKTHTHVHHRKWPEQLLHPAKMNYNKIDRIVNKTAETESIDNQTTQPLNDQLYLEEERKMHWLAVRMTRTALGSYCTMHPCTGTRMDFGLSRNAIAFEEQFLTIGIWHKRMLWMHAHEGEGERETQK